MSTQGQTSWPAKIAALFRADPKRAGTLVVLSAALLILWGRMLMGGKTPAAAHAFVQKPQVEQSDNLFAATQPRASSATDASLQKWARDPVIPMTRNLFSIPLDYYPRIGARVFDENTGEGFWPRLAKSLSVKADQQEQRRILIDNVRTAAASLTLQSTMLGNQPSAMVNGVVIREGSVLNGFSVLKIESRRIIVERESIKLEILMQ